jgi:hypothetical protein
MVDCSPKTRLPRLIESGCFEAIISKSASKAGFSFSFIPKVLSE